MQTDGLKTQSVVVKCTNENLSHKIKWRDYDLA